MPRSPVTPTPWFRLALGLGCALAGASCARANAAEHVEVHALVMQAEAPTKPATTMETSEQTAIALAEPKPAVAAVTSTVAPVLHPFLAPKPRPDDQPRPCKCLRRPFKPPPPADGF